jgi:hypothetical protein
VKRLLAESFNLLSVDNKTTETCRTLCDKLKEEGASLRKSWNASNSKLKTLG